MLATKPIILVIDDEPAILSAMASVLQDESNSVETTTSPDVALEMIGSLVPDLVFLDIFIPNTNGIDLLMRIKKEYPAQKVIIMSGYGNISLAVQALKQGAIDFIEKPFSMDDILDKVAQYCSVRNEQEKNSILSQSNKLIGESYLFKELIQYVHLIIPLDNHLLIYGPRGVGKNHLSHYIHTQKYKNGDAVYIEINGLENPSLEIDYALFNQDGSMIVKHVDALSRDAQKKLLSVMERATTKVRVFCLTDKNLYKQVIDGLFSEDLFYSLNSTPIEIPSLNKRRFDIPLLVHHYLTHINTATARSLSCSTQAMRLLRNYTWTENCRELKQLLETVTKNMPPDASISIDHLQTLLHNADLHLIEEQRFQRFTSLHEATQSFQKKFLLYQLKKNRYDLDQVSNILSMDVIELRNELNRLDISLSL